MSLHRRVRILFEATLAVLSGVAFVLTLLMRDWLERFFGPGADNHRGWIELIVTISLFAVAVLSAMAARGERRRARLGVISPSATRS